MSRHGWMVFVAGIMFLALGSAARAAAGSTTLLLVQGSEDLNVIPFGQLFESLVIGYDHSLMLIQGTAPENALVYAGTIQQEDFDRLLAAIAAMQIGIQPSCTSFFGGILAGDTAVSNMRIVWFGRRRVHTFTLMKATSHTCSPAVDDFILALGHLLFIVERDPKTVVIH